VVAIAPRYPERLLGMIEALDDEELTLAEVARRVGAAAERAGMLRPSPVHVRALVAELRLRREEDREARRAALEEMTGRLPYAIGNAYEAEAAATRARARVRARRQRR
jgi:protein involved in temperature-dependent protein secretion